MVKKTYLHGEDRPWTDAFKQKNPPHSQHPSIYVEPIKSWHIFKGDRVEIMVGKDQGKQGLVNSIIKERNWVYVEGRNCDYVLQGQSKLVPPSCIKSEKPLLVTSQVKLVDPADNKPTDIEWRYTEKGERVRVSLSTGRIIPLPTGAKELEDFVNPSTYVESEVDTKEDDLVEVTFKPNLCSFEQDIMNVMKIKETRKRAKTYWY